MNIYSKHNTILAVAFMLLWLFTSARVYAQPQPELTCVSVNENGSLYVGWNIPSGTFDGFRLFYKKTTEAFYNSLDFLPTITSGSIPVTDAQTEKYDVFLITFNNSPAANSPESVHLNNMLLVVSNGGIGSGIARLDWSPMKAVGAPEYIILRSMDNVNFIEIGRSNSLIYFDTIEAVCDLKTIYYKIEIPLTGCWPHSSTGSGTFKDDNRPEDPSITYVTINNGLAEIHWEHSLTPDVDGYILGVKDGAAYLDHDTTDFVNFIIDDFTDRPTYRYPCDESVTYVLRAKDQCGNQSSGILNYNRLHHTILISGEIEAHCNRQATLTWNHYISMDPEVSTYEVYRSENGNIAELAGKVSASEAESYTFTDPLMLSNGSLYTYWVKAVNDVNTISSESCQVYLAPVIEFLTDFDLNLITVSNDNYIAMQASGAPDELIGKVNVYRGTSQSSGLQLLFSNNWSNSPVQLSDYDALVHESSYFYQLVATDACGYELGESLLFRSILLELTQPEDESIRLNWNAFMGWGDYLKNYQVYRFDGDIPAPGFPKPVPPETLFFNDLISEVSPGMVTYYVEAVHEDGRKSLSNTVSLVPEAEVLVPTAFRIGGFTPQFIPILKNVEPTAYLFMIYNHWGQLVFETTNVEEGWDGSMNGSPSPPGAYIWMLNFSDFNGNKISNKGVVTIVK
ncbi:MAG: gliding motility-associated C-terminal domain-containing protein [Lentimicrobium sp.]|nr:gliding motility-associated C-terminal domain-containing protein [Lentimicrobium sp.]MDD2528107.1 gliding motility-associated C-terminal domain-containing protein [Lentimicrobiaceae bacterium]